VTNFAPKDDIVSTCPKEEEEEKRIFYAVEIHQKGNFRS
jgi:hypothetical protein